MAHVRTIWRAFQASSEVLECRPCGVTVTQVAATEKLRHTSQNGAFNTECLRPISNREK